MGALCEAILEQIEQRTGMTHLELTPDAIDRLCQYRWPGNVRELRNVLEKAAMLSDKNSLSAEDLESILPKATISAGKPGKTVTDGDSTNFSQALAEFERAYLSNALSSAHGRVDDAAKAVGMARATLYRKLKAYGLLSQE